MSIVPIMLPYDGIPFSPLTYLYYASSASNAAASYASKLTTLASSLTAPVINPVFPSATAAPPVSISSPPSYLTFTWNPGVTVPNPFTGTLNIDPYLPATFDDNPPALVFGSAPTPPTEPLPAAPPIDTNIPLPTEPVLEFPPPPALLSISTYQFDGVNIPSFDETVSALTLADPTIIPYTPQAEYTSGLLTELHAKITARLNGASGITPEVEQAIWDRGRDREVKQYADSLAELERMEALGYAFPPGVYLDARLKLTNEFAAQSYGHSREVMIKAAELEQANVKQAIEQATALESRLIESWNQVEQRTLEGAKYATQAGIETYNAKVRAYTAYVETYKTKAAIYEAQIRGELSKVEAYKAEIAAEEAKAQINTALVQQYKTEVDVVASTIEIYKAELAAVQTRAEIEKLKIEVYGEEIKAFVAKVNAYTAQVEGYKAATQAEGVKQEAYKTSVEAYTAQVGAQVKVIDAKIAEYKGRIEAKATEYEGYKAAVGAEAERIKGLSSFNSATADAYKALVSGEAAYNETLTKQWQVALDQAQRVSDIANNAAKMNADLYLQSRGIATDGAKVGAQVFSQLAAAALNAVNWSQSWQQSQSTSYGYQESYGVSQTTTLSVQG